MNAVHFNRGGTLISGQSNISLMRSSIIIADKTWFSPSDQTVLQHKKLFLDNPASINFKSKLKIFEISSREYFSKQLDKDLDNTITNIPILLKELKKIKHPTPDTLIDIKNLEKVVSDIYLQIAEERQEKFEELGMVQLEHFIGSSFFENLDNEENAKEVTGDFVNHDLKDIVQLNFKNREGVPFVFSLIGDTNKEDIFPASVPANEVGEKDKNCFWLDDVLDITGLECLSAADLEILRISVTEERKAFNKAMDIWIHESRKDSVGFDGLHYYQHTVKEAAKQLNIAIWNVPMMMAFNEFQARYFLRIGEIPVSNLWKYFHQAKCIEDEIFNSLMNDINEQSFAGRWPVLSLGIKNNQTNKLLMYNDFIEREIDTNPMKRKVINLD
jgi:hypothetical protein